MSKMDDKPEGRKPLRFKPRTPPPKKKNPTIQNLEDGDSEKKEAPEERTSDVPTPSKSKEYVFPWDTNTYYPIILPWRKPGSVDPDTLDEEEFGESSVGQGEDESRINPAAELDLMVETEERRMLVFKFPRSLPVEKKTCCEKGTGSGKVISKKGCGLEELPAGFMGKLMVYKSGAVKMKLGNQLLDVCPGVKVKNFQEIAAINAKEKHCCSLGTYDKVAVVTPNVESCLDDIMSSN